MKKIEPLKQVVCPACKGSGQAHYQRGLNDTPAIVEIRDCPDCNGTGCIPVPSTPAKDTPKNFSLRQKEFADWQEYNFGKGEVSDMIHGMSEEIGEMSHAYLKSKNKIRGMTPEMAKEKMADAFADTVTFGIQAMTALGLNAEEVLNKTFLLFDTVALSNASSATPSFIAGSTGASSCKSVSKLSVINLHLLTSFGVTVSSMQ